MDGTEEQRLRHRLESLTHDIRKSELTVLDALFLAKQMERAASAIRLRAARRYADEMSESLDKYPEFKDTLIRDLKGMFEHQFLS